MPQSREELLAQMRERDRAARQDPTNARAARWRIYNREKQQRYRLVHPERYRAAKAKYRASHLEQEREKGREREAKRRRTDPAYRAKANAAASRWRTTNPEKAKRKSTHDGQARRAKKKLAVSTLSLAQKNELKRAKGSRCDYCGKKDKNITIDHLTPLGPEGPDILWNVTLACRSCNSRKKRGPLLQPVQPFLLTLAPSKKKQA